ncbi:LPS export ABC transporter permease LptG [Carnimonas nigrificans]|uniref:LPS export ABC transporter permease LptG n=1 Tax=Carnimonas nigrificans TaxID=64323 RepID=UPI00046EDACE|nr:LPS export ABC transporter permease LptG [Carnimonas nigrificans]
MFSLFDRYVARTVLAAMLIVEFTLLALDFSIGLLGALDDISANYGFVQLVIYQLMRLPWRIYEYAPLAVLLGGLLGLGSMAGANELTAMRAAGSSITRLSIAVLKPLVLVIVIMMAVGQWLVPHSEQAAESYRAERLQSSGETVGRGSWQIEGNTFYKFGAITSNNTLIGVSRYRYQDNRVVEASYAQRALWDEQSQHWRLEDINTTRFEENGTTSQHSDSAQWETRFDPRFLSLVIMDLNTQPLTSLWEFAHYQDSQGISSNDAWLFFWQKLLQPFTFIGLMLVAVSFVFGPLRTKTAGTRIFIGIVVGLCVKYLQDLLAPASVLLGFSPLWSVLLPIIVCYLVAFYLLRKNG